MIRVYLLSLSELEDPCVMESVLDSLDTERQMKVRRCRQRSDKIRSAGAGLLLQYAVREWEKKPEDFAADGSSIWIRRTAAQMCANTETREFAYQYGEKRKPYFRDLPLYFSLTHSGPYAACGACTEEIGLDLQEHKAADYDRLAGRFFTEAERMACAECRTPEEKRALFYLIWCRKEAYAKRKGCGLSPEALGCNVLDEEGAEYFFEDYTELENFTGSVCGTSLIKQVFCE